MAQNLPSGEKTVIPAPTKGKGKIEGVIIDSANSASVPFATVALIIQESGTPVNGTMADENGSLILLKLMLVSII